MISLRFSRLRAIFSNYQIWINLVLALLSGVILPIQANLNAQLARSLDSVTLATAISYFVGTIVLVVILSTRQFALPDWSALLNAPRWSLMGGIFGVWYIASSTYFISMLGTTLTFGLVVGGQAIAGIIVDHFGWLGVPRHRFTHHRQVAFGLLIVALFFLSQPK